MEFEAATDVEKLFHQTPPLEQIDPRKARFPCCIVWTPLPLVSWFLPFIGHIGIGREDGVILDFAGPHFVSVDHFNFGSVARYIQLSRDECSLSPKNEALESNEMITWDSALRNSTHDFQHRSYSLLTCNCHCFVANCLNRLCYAGHRRWNVVNLAALIFFRGIWVDRIAVLKSFLPPVSVLGLGFLLGGTNFLAVIGGFGLALVGWFLVGTYCFRNLVRL
ncbi:protein REVERSION-TO-ETHYLENE SENSITIVITY1-like isoform X2 [Phalaenopsis equestris]|uniref:protein REVERSION-TO-ETHYLENE SENSITIVITY1-like isoform X2 n=1 Tax=Phalaenopsis equestris TaxID=78828 RepID=UPI0009E5E8C1|nr:protein REVERSION-TO-ETHYLENE SENSITIVITY1-like isoform X2 [Phalaenopsis equestris]